MSTKISVGAYLHIPFCAKKCGYCDFNAYSGYSQNTKARYVDAIVAEIRSRANPDREIATVFFGGGTPTELSAPDLSRILQTLRESFPVAGDAEITIEANPNDATAPFLAALREAGFNRLSFGVQTFDDGLLRLIDRVHSGEQATRAVGFARDAGFTNLSLDLMFALPRQTLENWARTLDTALSLDPPHLSIYGLILEEKTPFWGRLQRGKLLLPDEATEVSMFEMAIERTRDAGLFRYEIGNYARPGFESAHNRLYWDNADYLGFGAGATGYENGVRAVNVRRPSAYIDTVLSGKPRIEESETPDRRGQMSETVFLALRTTDGVDRKRFETRFQQTLESAFPDAVAKVVANGLCEMTETHLRLTEPRGLFLANDAMAEFV